MPPFDSPWEYIVNDRSGQFALTCMWSAMREALQMRAVWQAWLHSLTSGGLMWHWRLFSWTENTIFVIQIHFLLLQGDLVTVHPIHERDPVPLAVHHHPVTTTFAMFQVWFSFFYLLTHQIWFSDGWKHWNLDCVRARATRRGCDDGQNGDWGQCLQGGLHSSFGRAGEASFVSGGLEMGLSQNLLSVHLIWNYFQINCLPIQVLVDKGLVTRLSTIAAEKAKKTVTKIKAALAEEVMVIW